MPISWLIILFRKLMCSPKTATRREMKMYHETRKIVNFRCRSECHMRARTVVACSFRERCLGGNRKYAITVKWHAKHSVTEVLCFWIIPRKRISDAVVRCRGKIRYVGRIASGFGKSNGLTFLVCERSNQKRCRTQCRANSEYLVKSKRNNKNTGHQKMSRIFLEFAFFQLFGVFCHYQMIDTILYIAVHKSR